MFCETERIMTCVFLCVCEGLTFNHPGKFPTNYFDFSNSWQTESTGELTLEADQHSNIDPPRQLWVLHLAKEQLDSSCSRREAPTSIHKPILDLLVC